MLDLSQPGSLTSGKLPRPQTTPAGHHPHTPSSRTSGAPYRAVKTLAILVSAALGMAVLLVFLPAAGHDQLWFLLMAQRWVAGAQIYGPVIFDSNTPAVVWLSAIPVALAPHLHLAIPATAKLLVSLLELAVAAFSLSLVRRLLPSLSRAESLFLAFAFTSLFALLPARDFGQRDHLTALLCLPYLLTAALVLLGQSTPANSPPASVFSPLDGLRSPAAALAGIGICLKPQQALVPIAIEALLLLLWNSTPQPALSVGERSRLRRLLDRLHPLSRPEPRLLLLCGVLFFAAVHHYAPLFFTRTVPLLLQTYWAIGHLTPLQLLAEAPELHILAALAGTIFVWNRLRNAAVEGSGALHRLAGLSIAAGVAATLAYYLQGTGWYYQQLPALSFFGLALSFELVWLARSHKLSLPRGTPALAALLAGLALALTFHFSGYRFAGHPFPEDATAPITSPDPAIFRDLPPETPIAILGTSVEDTMMPVARFHLTWAQRMNNLWLLPAILRNTDPDPTHSGSTVPAQHRLSRAALDRLRATQRQWMVEDLERWRPQLVLVENCERPEVRCQTLNEGTEHRHDNLLAFFLADPAFASLWQAHYLPLRTAGSYTAYRRRD